MRSSRGPCHDLGKIKELVMKSRYRTTKRVRDYILNHGYDYAETVEDVICSIEEEHYHKTDELEAIPGTFADTYRHVECYEEEWYVKLFMDNDGTPSVQIWSLKEDGYLF